jgi:hypothetical protein
MHGSEHAVLALTGVVDEVMRFQGAVVGEEAAAAVAPDGDLVAGGPGGKGRSGVAVDACAEAER